MKELKIIEEIKNKFECYSIIKTENNYVITILEPYKIKNNIYNDENLVYNYIAGFAQKNYYKNIVQKLKTVIKVCEIKDTARIFCNSTLPEKYLMTKTNSGFIGKNSLFISDKYGVNNLIAGILLPLDKFKFDTDNTQSKNISCGNCKKCIEICPVNAIKENHYIDRNLCLQSLSSVFTTLTIEQIKNWNDTLYGCTFCSAICPFNKFNRKEVDCNVGEIDKTLTLTKILEAGLISEEKVKELFKSTALQMSWISGYALVRNAIIISYSKKINLELLDAYKTHSENIFKDIISKLLIIK